MDNRISLEHRIFTEDPYQKFAEQHNVKPEVWHKLYHTGYLWRSYSIPELADYVKIVTDHKLNISNKTISRWIKKTDVYHKAQIVIQKGVKLCTPEYFDEHADYVEKICLRKSQ